MTMTHDAHADATLTTLVRRAVEDLGRLVADHLKLARLELGAEARQVGTRVGLVAVAASLFGVGYLCAAVALSLFLARWLGAAGAFGAVGGGHALAGVVSLVVIGRRAQAAGALEESRRELERTRALLAPTEKAP
jgi:hypothetical protein